MDDSTPAEPKTTRTDRFPRWLARSLFAALGVLALGYGAILVYANFINDGPEAFDESDLAAVLTVSTTDAPMGDGTVPPPAETATTETATAETETTNSESTNTGTPDSESTDTETASPAGPTQWRIASGSEVGYRVKEVLFGVDTEGVGRTGSVSGGIEINGTSVIIASFDVDVASIESDDPRRDSQFSGRIMSTDEFPLATFVLTEPIELGTAPADGVTVTAPATGELTLRGVTNPVTFELTAQQENGRIGILGSIPVVFADYAIANPSFGGITTEDVGLVEFVLLLEPA